MLCSKATANTIIVIFSPPLYSRLCPKEWSWPLPRIRLKLYCNGQGDMFLNRVLCDKLNLLKFSLHFKVVFAIS